MTETPNGYGWYRTQLVNKEVSFEAFYPSNRPFLEINEELNGLPEAIIKNLLLLGILPVRILDLAGGSKSKFVRDLSTHPKFGSAVDVTNIDLTATTEEFSRNARAIQGDALDLSCLNQQYHFVHTNEFIKWLSRRNNFERPIEAYKQIANVLEHGGIALDTSHIFDEILKSTIPEAPDLRTIFAKYDVEILTIYGDRKLLIKNPFPDTLRTNLQLWRPTSNSY